MTLNIRWRPAPGLTTPGLTRPACALAAVAIWPIAASAQTAPAAPPEAAPVVNQDSLAGYFGTWFDRVNEAQASQPSWMTPLVTVTPRLEQEIRYDQFWQHLPNGGSLDNFGTGKGLELIPTASNEVIIGVPPYEEKTVGNVKTTGWADGPTVLIKQRLFSENAASGDMIVTAFLSATVAAGGAHFSQHAWIVTPTIAVGKGWGPFDIQATSGIAVPTRRLDDLGTQWLNNIAFQYHAFTYFWPEFEVNDTVWLNGSARGGKDQVFLTPGIIFGRLHLGGRVKAAIGVGYQFAVSPRQELHPELDPQYDHNWILSARLSF
jgi:hypothetical protein